MAHTLNVHKANPRVHSITTTVTGTDPPRVFAPKGVLVDGTDFVRSFTLNENDRLSEYPPPPTSDGHHP